VFCVVQRRGGCACSQLASRCWEALELKACGIRRLAQGVLKGRSGQMVAEYSLLVWFFTLVGVATLVTFFFAFEEGTIAYYEDIVNVVCLPFP